MAEHGPSRLVLAAADDAALAGALRGLAAELAIPASAAPGLASRIGARIAAERPRRATPRVFLVSRALDVPALRRWSLRRPSLPRLRRGTVLALAAVLLLAAIAAAAVGFDLPGLRIIFGPPPSAPAAATPGTSMTHAPGALLGLGTPLGLDEAQALVDFPIPLPPAPDLGPPDATYLRLARVALVWAPGPGLPPTADAEIGLLLNEFRGSYDSTLVLKVAQEGTRVEEIEVDGAPGYWIDGAPHAFVYIDPAGSRLEDSYRSVGDTLVWTREGITFRLETGLGRDAAIRLAESLR